MKKNYKYEVNCNDCGYTFFIDSDTELTYEDVTCEKCGCYESLFLQDLEEEEKKY